MPAVAVCLIFNSPGGSTRDESCSSAGSVIRVPVEAGQESDCSSDGSVIRVPIGEDPDDEGSEERSTWGGGTPLGSPEASEPNREGGISRQGSSVRFASDQSAQSPSHSGRKNLQAAARYFATNDTADASATHAVGPDAGGWGGSCNGSAQIVGTNGENTQVDENSCSCLQHHVLHVVVPFGPPSVVQSELTHLKRAFGY